MLTLHCIFLVNLSQAEIQAYITAAGISNFTLVGGPRGQDAHNITLQPEAGQSLTDEQKTALLAALPGGADVWSFV